MTISPPVCIQKELKIYCVVRVVVFSLASSVPKQLAKQCTVFSGMDADCIIVSGMTEFYLAFAHRYLILPSYTISICYDPSPYVGSPAPYLDTHMELRGVSS